MTGARSADRRRKIVFLVIYLCLTALFAEAYYSRYCRWRDCFNELGRCYDPDTAQVYTTSGFVWGLMAAIFALLSLLSLVRLRR